MKNNINTNNNLSLSEQREKLLKLNPDLIYGVYELLEENEKNISLKLVENTMTCYPNMLENLEIPDDCSDINLVNLGALRKGKIENLQGSANVENKNIILVSGGILEYYISNTGKTHIVNIFQRDNETFADAFKFTTPAGRCVGENLEEEAEKEYFEEGPFLGKNEKGEYVLAIPDGNKNGKNYTKESIKLFLERKYNLDTRNKQDEKYIKIFERNFKPLKYSELGDILKEIVENDRFMYYERENGHIESLEKHIKTIKIGDKNFDTFCFFDKENNTLEYRKIIKIKKKIDGFTLLGGKFSRLFLEGRFQKVKAPKLENINEDVVPIIKKISEIMQKN